MEQASFLKAAHTYKDTIYRIALNYFGNREDAEDTVQDVLMKLYTTQKNFDSEEYLRNWIIRVTINSCKNTLRMPWRNRSVELSEIAATATFEHEEQSYLFMSVMKLPEKYRTVLYFFYYEDMSVKEIAQLLKLNESAVTTRLSRARNQLKMKLAEVYKDE